MNEKSVRASFVEHFGEEQAKHLEEAANSHNNEVHSNKGSDPFKWAILITIGYECLSRPEFREHHKLSVPLEEFKKWCINHGELASHTGDCDYLALLCGHYNEYVKMEPSRL